MEVPHPAGVINKSAEEEGNGCNQLVKPTLGSARRAEGRGGRGEGRGEHF